MGSALEMGDSRAAPLEEFQNFSYVLKIESPELGITGIRDACVFSKDGQLLAGWLDDPYDPTERGPMTRNISERPEYDSRFPDHPLSRARRVLDHLQRTITIDSFVKRQPKFSFGRHLPRRH